MRLELCIEILLEQGNQLPSPEETERQTHNWEGFMLKGRKGRLQVWSDQRLAWASWSLGLCFQTILVYINSLKKMFFE